MLFVVTFKVLSGHANVLVQTVHIGSDFWVTKSLRKVLKKVLKKLTQLKKVLKKVKLLKKY